MTQKVKTIDQRTAFNIAKTCLMADGFQSKYVPLSRSSVIADAIHFESRADCSFYYDLSKNSKN